MLKVFESAISEQNPRGPRYEFRPTLPICPQAGSANGPDVGRASVQVSRPVRSVFEKTSGDWLSAPFANGVNHSRLPPESRLVPVLRVPVAMGRHGPASEIWPHSPRLGVNGRPPL